MVNILIFGSNNVKHIIKQICIFNKNIAICDYSNPKKIKLYKNGLLTNSINLLPYTIVVVIDIYINTTIDDINVLLNYWVNKLCRYNKRIVFIYNIMNSHIVNYKLIKDSLGDNCCMFNSRFYRRNVQLLTSIIG